MNDKLYVENSNGALKLARKEVYDSVQQYLCFYRESKGFTKYYQREADEILKMAREKWQDIMNTMNAHALYLGTSLYKKHLAFANQLKELMEQPETGHYPIVKAWKVNYTDLSNLHDKAEVNDKAVGEDFLFMDYFNELRIAANKEFLSELLM